MSVITATPSSRVTVVGRTGLGLMAIALCLAGALITVELFDQRSITPVAAVSFGVAWFVGSVAAAALLTSGASHFTRAIDIRRATLIYFLVSFGVLSLGWRRQFEGTSGIINRDSVPLALLVAQGAVIAWAVGYRFIELNLLGSLMANARSIVAPRTAWRLRSPYTPIVLYLGSALSTAYHLKAGTFAYLADPNSLIANPGSYGPILELGQLFGKAAIVVAVIGVLTAEQKRLRAIAILTVLTATEVGIGAFSGTKTPFILLATAVAVPLFAQRRRVPWKIVLASVTVLAVGTSFTGAYRVRLTEAGGRLQGDQALDAFTETGIETLQPTGLAKSVPDGIDSLGPRLRQIDNVALVVQRTPSEIAYKGAGNLLIDPVRNTVPRALWPSKPTVTTALDFSRQYYNLPPGLITASAITVIGDLYRHGGIAVVIIGMAVLGATVRLVDDHWHPFRDIRLAVLYASIFLTLVNLESDVASVITGLPLAIISGLIASKLAFARSVSTEA